MNLRGEKQMFQLQISNFNEWILLSEEENMKG